jgi:hypothetical protein
MLGFESQISSFRAICQSTVYTRHEETSRERVPYVGANWLRSYAFFKDAPASNPTLGFTAADSGLT